MPVSRVDELRRDADAVSGLAHAALEHIARAELPPGLAHVDVLALVGEARIARDDVEAGELRERGQDVVDESVGEELLLRIVAHVGERKHGDRRSSRSAAPSVCGLRRLPRRPSPQRQTRTGCCDVLERDLAGVREGEIDLAPHLRVHRIGEEHAAGRRLAFEPRRDVDAVAEDVVAVDDDVAEIDADAKGDRLRRRRPPLRSAIAFWTAIAHCTASTALANSTSAPSPIIFTMRPRCAGDRRVEELAPDLSERRERADLVLAHHAAVADHVGGKDRRKTPRDRVLRSSALPRPAGR